ncbi:hypothetical protein CspeluHIS016_0204430 [Cutaneotrichosporon spelunceum]|uniref:Uncharacterized protein n=1 Tax=Cutaneotrichosporon spelunceum TaxID=1672016 RepID=A0AAD3YB03_9TREE|nr:hypothetical protein CspeluHIS016_0204430 [Cutaneotrichosporon spelunceum]
MKVAITLLATLALLAASPMRLNQKRNLINMEARENDNVFRIPLAVSGQCDDGWTAFKAEGKGLCCSPSTICDGELEKALCSSAEDSISSAPTYDVDTRNNGFACRRFFWYCDALGCFWNRTICKFW